MRFALPHMLWLLIFVPMIAAFWVWAYNRRASLLDRFGTPKALQRYQLSPATVANWIRFTLFLLGTTAIVVALARPQWGYHEQRIVSRGVDMMIAIDTSDSMMARDFQPNRLSRAKELLRNLIWEAQGARVGVVAFSGAAAVMCPLTLDYNMAATALKAVDINTVSAGGTNIGAAIRAAIGSFEISGGNDRILILLTDGEQTEQLDELNSAVAKAEEEGIKIFAIGIGSEDGVPIPTMRGFKRDSAGQVVQTRLDFEKLQEIAQNTQGEAIRAEKMGAGEIAEISAALAQFKGQKQQDKTVRIYHERYSWFVGFAILCFVLEALLSSVRHINWWRRRKHTAVAGAIIIGATVFPASVFAYPGEGYVRSREGYQEYSSGDYEDAVLQYQRASQLAPQDPMRLYNLGAAAAKAGKEQEARQALRSVFDAENPALNANALYSAATLDHRDIRDEIKTKKPEWEKGLGANAEEIDPIKSEIEGVIGKLEKVIGEYRDAILTKPNDTDIKANFELAKKDLEELKNLLEQLNQQQQQQQQQQQPQQNEQQQNEDQQNEQNQQSGQQNQDQQGQQGEQQDKQDQQGEQEQDQQNQPEQDQGQEQDQNQDQQGQENQDQQGEQEQNQNQSGQQGEQEQQDQQPDQKGKPTPTPTPSPTPNATPGPGEGQGDQGQSGQAPPVPVGQMNAIDVDRLLNTLPPEDQQALQLMFGTDPNPQEDMQNDW